jgi:hypothetical protein
MHLVQVKRPTFAEIETTLEKLLIGMDAAEEEAEGRVVLGVVVEEQVEESPLPVLQSRTEAQEKKRGKRGLLMERGDKTGAVCSTPGCGHSNLLELDPYTQEWYCQGCWEDFEGAEEGVHEERAEQTASVGQQQVMQGMWRYQLVQGVSITPKSAPDIRSTVQPGAVKLTAGPLFVVTERRQGTGQTYLKLKTGGWAFTHHPSTRREICILQVAGESGSTRTGEELPPRGGLELPPGDCTPHLPTALVLEQELVRDLGPPPAATGMVPKGREVVFL